MSRLTKTKNKKKQTRFQKLWSRVESLKKELKLRDSKLDVLAKRVETEIFPAEKEVALATVDLLHKLLALGQRKSWANWQRHEIDRWVADSVRLLSSFGLIDDKMEKAIVEYDAYCLGVELDENDDRALGEQLQAALSQREQDERDNAKFERQQMHDELAIEKESIIKNMILKELGPRPVSEESLFDDEEFFKKIQLEYDQRSAELRLAFEADIDDTLLDILSGEEDDEDDAAFDDVWGNLGDEGFDPFSAGLEPPDDTNNAAKLDSKALRKIFRSTAAVLHPDRETDPVKQREKQKLMAQLLQARKHNDVMALLNLYQEYVIDGSALTREDEKQLVDSLEFQISQLQMELESYSPPSMLHEAAWGLYSHSKKATDHTIAEHLKKQKKQVESLRRVTPKIKSMPTLKPLLQERYDYNVFSDFDEFVGWD